MIKLIALLVLLFVGLLFGHTLIGVEGRVIIALPETMIEMSIISSLIIIAFAVLLFWILEWAFKRLFRAIAGSKSWLGAFSKRQQNQSFYDTINAMLLNESDAARKAIGKTHGGDFQGTNALMAAELEIQAGNIEQAQAMLIQAADNPKAHDIAVFKQAELALRKHRGEEAMTLLTGINGKIRTSRAFVLLKLRILAALDDWPQIQSVASTHKKLLGEEYIQWASQCIKGEFAAIASKQGANALKQHWLGLSKAAKKDQANQAVYAQLLIDQGLHDDAEAALVKFANQHTQATHLALFKQLQLPSPALAMRYIEGQIKRHPENAELLCVLAHLAFNSNDIALAHRAILKATALRDEKTDKALLAKILERSSDFESANALYQELVR